jgi:acyl carrier protein
MYEYVIEQMRQQRTLDPDPDAVYSILTDVICEQLGVKREAVTPDASFVDDLGAD